MIQSGKQTDRDTIVSLDIEERGPLTEQLLFWLVKHPYQSTNNLAFVFQAHASTIRRNVASLIEQGCVASLHLSSLAQTHPLYYATPAGIASIANLVEGNAQQLARMWHADLTALRAHIPRLPAFIPLQLMMYAFVARSPRLLAAGGGSTSIRWHVQQQYRHTFLYKKKKKTCLVDGVVVLHSLEQEDAWFCSFWLIDPGFVGKDDLAIMQACLEHFLQWRESQERWSTYHAFPPIFILASSDHQRDLWIHSANEEAHRLRLAPLKGACATINKENDFESLQWKALDGSGTIHVPQLLTSQPLIAIPPGLLAPRPLMHETGQGAQPMQKKTRDLVAIVSPPTNDPPSLSLLLNARHMEIVQTLYATPLLTRREMAALMRMEAPTIKRYLVELRQWGCLSILTTRYGKRLMLSEGGLRLIAARLGVPLRHLATRDEPSGEWHQRGVRQALYLIEHTSGVLSFLAQMQQEGWHYGHQLIWWETQRCFSRYRYQGHWHNLIPDALFTYRTEERTVEAWVEWDTGSMHRLALTTKFEAYAHYLQSSQYRLEHASLPRLLIIVPQSSRERAVQQLVQNVLGDTPLHVGTTSQPLLQTHGPLAAIWKGKETHEQSLWMEC